MPNIAIQMDPIDSIKIEGDTTYALALEATKRGYTLWYYTPDALAIKNGKVAASLQPVQIHEPGSDPFYSLGQSVESDFSDIDIVLMRQDPPYDMNYLTYTYMLESLPNHVRVINDPKNVRDCPEKVFVTQFSEFMPPTLISSNMEKIEAFKVEYKDVVIKPLYAHGGKDIHRLDGQNDEGVIKKVLTEYQCPLVAQQFLPEVKEGDKRIILIDGEPAGALLRIPAEGDIRSNLVVGGTPQKTTLTKQEEIICEALGSELRKRDLMLVGIDVIGGRYLTEINVTSPTGIRSIDALDDTNLSAIFWDTVF